MGGRGWRAVVVVALVAMAGWPAAEAGAASLTLTGFSPTSGHVGTVVTLTGAGFAADDLVTFNGVPSAPKSVATNGTSLKVSVPSFASSGPIMVESQSTGAKAGLPGSTFRVTAGLKLSTTHAYPGDSIVVTGSGLSPNQHDTIEIGSSRVGTALIDARGSFELGVGVPWSTKPGRTSLQVIDPSAGSVIVVLFVIGDWEQQRHDAAGTGLDTYETVLSPSTVPGLKSHWAVPLPDAQHGGVPIGGLTTAEGLVFTGWGSGGVLPFSGDAGLAAVKASTGAPAWSYDADNYGFIQIMGAPVVANGVVYMAEGFGELLAFDAKTGTELWASQADGAGGGPVVANGTLYLTTSAGLEAFNTANGLELWSTGGDLVGVAGLLGPPAVAATGTVIVSAGDGNLHAFNGSTGAPLWTKPGGGGAAPAIVGNVVYSGAANGSVYARHVGDGSLVWSVATGGTVLAPAVSGGVVYAPSFGGGSLLAIQASTGTTLWSVPVHPGSAPAVANGVVYIDESDKAVHALDASNGNDLWSVKPGDGVGTAPIVSNGQVLFGCVATLSVPCLLAYGL